MEHPHQSQPPFSITQGNSQQPDVLPNFRKRKTRNSTKQKRTVTRERDWKEKETSALLKFVNLPEYRPRRGTRSQKTEWELIVKAMHDELGADRVITTKRCKEKMKTLTGDKYYKKANSNWDRVKKEKPNFTEDDWRETIEDCGLTVEWYEAIKEYIQGPCEERQGKCGMQMQCRELDPNVTTDSPPSSRIPMVDGSSEPIQTKGAEKTRKSELKKQSFAQQFNSLNDSQRSTFLDLYSATNSCFHCGPMLSKDDSVSDLLKKLSLMQNRRELSIYEDVIALKKLGLVSTLKMGEGSADDDEAISELYIDFERLHEHKRFFEKVMRKNPVYDTHRIIEGKGMVPLDAWFAPSGIRVLKIDRWSNLKEVDLSEFGKLRVLFIWGCYGLREIIACEGLDELRCLQIQECSGYNGYPPLQKFPNLQEFLFEGNSGRGVGGGVVDVSGCVRLRKLTIWADGALTSIRGLEGVRSLTALDLNGCKALQNIPDIGHMKELTCLNVSGTAIEEIKGVEKLSSLEVLQCRGSKLKTLPDLSLLPQLKSVQVHGCPVTKDPSSPFFGKDRVQFNHENKHVDVSDLSDSEQDVSLES